MGDSVMMVTAILLAAVLMFIFPLMSISERNDDITQTVVQTATSEFVDKIAVAGEIKPVDYENYLSTLYTTGNTYEVEIEVQHLDENPGVKTATTSRDLIGENVRYSTFTSTILEDMYPITTPTGVSYSLKQGDNVIVTAKNTNTTIAQMLRSFLYSVGGSETYQVAASATSMVINAAR